MIYFCWTGFGVLAPIILILVAEASSLIADYITGITDYANHHGWVYSIGCLIGSVICWYIGKYLNNKEAEVLIDPATQKQYIVKNTHTFFGIPFEYWYLIGIFYAIGCFIVHR